MLSVTDSGTEEINKNININMKQFFYVKVPECTLSSNEPNCYLRVVAAKESIVARNYPNCTIWRERPTKGICPGGRVSTTTNLKSTPK